MTRDKQAQDHSRHRRCPHCGGCVDHLCPPAQELATARACRELNQEQRDEWRERAEQLERELAIEGERRRKAIAERDREMEIAQALKRRVGALEAEVRSLQTYDREDML